MRRFLSIAFITIAAFLYSCTNGQTQNGKTNLSAEEFAQKIKELPDAPIIDVRTAEEFSKGHIQNAKNFDWYEEMLDKQVASFDKTKPILVYCLSGGRSSAAASKLRASGFKTVYELNGGIMKWRGANLPETTETASASAGMSEAQFDALLQTDKIVFIDFYADWCAPCKKMKPYLDEIAKDMADKVVVVRINADDNQVLCKDMHIDALPTLQVYKNKLLTWSNTGFIEKEEVLKNLK
jgi:thioredoxin